MVDALCRKVHEMHVASLSVCQLDLRQLIVNHTIEDDLYVHVKNKLQQQIIEKRYERYKLEEDGILTYKNIIYIPHATELRRLLWMKSIKLHIMVTQDITRQFLHPKSSIFGQI